MPTPAENLNAQQQLLYEIPDDQSSMPQPLGDDTGELVVRWKLIVMFLERWNVVRSNGEPKVPNRRTESRRKSKFQFCCACLFFSLTIAMLVFGVLLGSIIFYKLYGKCGNEQPVSGGFKFLHPVFKGWNQARGANNRATGQCWVWHNVSVEAYQTAQRHTTKPLQTVDTSESHPAR